MAEADSLPSSPQAAAPAQPAAGPSGKYRKLPGRAPTFRLRGYGQVQLYLMDAFLLQIDVIAVREVYTKFAYKDIQAIEIVRTARGAIWNWVFVVSALLLGLALFAGGSGGLYMAAGVVGFFAALLAINALRGPTCRAAVRTVTGQHPLRSLVRLRPARKALALIAERVEAVQGALDQPAAEREMENFLARRAGQNQSPATPSPV